MTTEEVSRMLAAGGGGGAGSRALQHTRNILSFGTRVPGEIGWNRTMSYILATLSPLPGWRIEQDCFTAVTPLGPKPMCNIVASYNPQAGPCLLDLAAHFESKLFTAFSFLAATDSACPVGIMLELAEALTPALQAKRDQPDSDLPCFRLIFFDGEEAFVQWTGTDSLYGARHLATKWSTTPDPYRWPSVPRLGGMRALVLLDLLGQKRPALTWHFESGRPYFEAMQRAESRLREGGWLKGEGGPTGGEYLTSHGRGRGSVQDDHIPFLKKDVPIVHLISHPFPRIWHKEADNWSAIDAATVGDLSAIFRLAIARLFALSF